MKKLLPFVLFFVTACLAEDTTMDQIEPNRPYVLTHLNGDAFGGRATIVVSPEGMVSGSAPCNSYGTTLEGTAPDFALGPIRATRRACPDMSAETEFFRALTAVRHIAFLGPTLILRSDAGDEMVFQLENE